MVQAMGIREKAARWLDARGLDLLLQVLDALREPGEVGDLGEPSDSELDAIVADEEQSMRLAIALAMSTPRCAACGWKVAGSMQSKPGQEDVADHLVVVCRNEACSKTAEQIVFADRVSMREAVIVGALRQGSFGGVS